MVGTSMKKFIVAPVLVLCMNHGPAMSRDLPIGQGLCYEIENIVNLLATFTYTKCLPAAGDRKGALSFLIISEKPVFSTEKSKKAWLVTVTGATGKTLRDHRTILAEKIIVSDVHLMKQFKGFSFPAALAKQLQAQISSDQITIHVLYDRLNSALKPFVVQRPQRSPQ